MGQIGGEPVGVRLGQHEGHHLLGGPTAVSGKGRTSGLQELPHPNVSKPHFVCLFFEETVPSGKAGKHKGGGLPAYRWTRDKILHCFETFICLSVNTQLTCEWG